MQNPGSPFLRLDFGFCACFGFRASDFDLNYTMNHPMQKPTCPGNENIRAEALHLPRLRPRFQILVECTDEEVQKAFPARMASERRQCRVLTL